MTIKDQTINVDGVNIRYRDSGGPGMPVLLSHGIGGSLELWNPQLEGIGDRLRVIAWDMPGHGLSDLGPQPNDPDTFARIAWRFANALGIDRLVAGGNSMGGAVSVRMAGLAPQRVAALVLADAASLEGGIFPPFRLMVLPLLGELMTKPNEAGVDRQMQAIFHKSFVPSDELRQVIIRNTFKPGGEKAFLATLRRMSGFRGQNPDMCAHSLKVLRGIKVPVLFVHGRQDVVIPLQHSVSAHAVTPNARLLVLEDCGHTPQLEKPEAFNQALLKLVQELG